VKEGYLTEDQYKGLQEAVYGSRKIGLLMEPVDGVLKFLPLLVAEGHDIRVITARGEIELKIAEEWVFQQGLRLDFIGVGNNSKSEAASGLDVYVDDDLDNLKKLTSVVPYLFLFSWGYNAHADASAIAMRVLSWKDLYCAIREITGVR
jgi:uncharacterized HAD superfamily protein